MPQTLTRSSRQVPQYDASQSDSEPSCQAMEITAKKSALRLRPRKNELVVEDDFIPVEDHGQFRVSTYKTKTEIEPCEDLCQEIKAVKVTQPTRKTLEYAADRT